MPQNCVMATTWGVLPQPPAATFSFGESAHWAFRSIVLDSDSPVQGVVNISRHRRAADGHSDEAVVIVIRV